MVQKHVKLPANRIRILHEMERKQDTVVNIELIKKLRLRSGYRFDIFNSARGSP